MSKITIDNIEYNLNDLTDEVKNNIGMLQAVEQEIQRLNVQLAIAQTARIAYARVVKDNLPKVASETVTNN